MITAPAYDAPNRGLGPAAAGWKPVRREEPEGLVTDTVQPFHVIIATDNGQVFERDLDARTAVMAVCMAAVDVDPRLVITNVHARLAR